MKSDNKNICYRCKGKGIIYQYEGDLGDSSTCPGCDGKKTISNLYFQCIKCEGTGKCYPYANKSGLPYMCPLCKDKGYTTKECMKCVNCQGEGKEYPFPNKMGNPRSCRVCSGQGYFVQSKLSKTNTAPSPLNNGNEYLSQCKVGPVFDPSGYDNIHTCKTQRAPQNTYPTFEPSNNYTFNKELDSSYQFGNTFYPSGNNKPMAQGYYNNLIKPYQPYQQQNINQYYPTFQQPGNSYY